MKNRYIEIGQRIKQAREEANLSQKDLAEKIGHESGTAISLLESGDRKVAIVDLEEIAKILNREVGYFLGEKSQQKTDVVRLALRADKNLSQKDKETLLTFYNYVRAKKE